MNDKFKKSYLSCLNGLKKFDIKLVAVNFPHCASTCNLTTIYISHFSSDLLL